MAPACLLAILLAILTACSGGGEAAPPPAPTPDRGTPLSDFETRTVSVARESFCEAIATEAVARALVGDPTRATSYAPGEKVRLTSEVKDVAHEFGCVFKGRKKAEARAWVFAPPVTRARAKQLVTAASKASGCAAVPRAPAFGKPSVATVCPNTGTTSTKAITVRYAGLFGDAWLSCSVAAPTKVGQDKLVDRAGRWCVEVAKAAGPSPSGPSTADPTPAGG